MQNHAVVCECEPYHTKSITDYKSVFEHILKHKLHCVKYECLGPEDCPEDKKCDLRRRCKDPCESFEYCASKELCVVEHHEPDCKCPRHLQGNPFRNGTCSPYSCEKNEKCELDFLACIDGTCEGNLIWVLFTFEINF